ncbi:Piso0_002509 [Millerozyma farinosa CBS 7064]|uniref:Piso0_002509 protein n=1 Tax=Pichia sorbitophila (strain ATCC MYA-4447 / BCRC 22081 / CBS 7064 / NBRC 10061 / NRRL Y-12695) TaxID=559304 RepID=G8YF85_PICSO|nr:Piso0_002509 [Millerozyma farinosa CBS 7064]
MSTTQTFNTSNNSIAPLCSIKTSKQWVLPPRPKPGRKPVNEMSDKEKKKNRDKEKHKDISEARESKTGSRPTQVVAASGAGTSTGPVALSKDPALVSREAKCTTSGKSELDTLNKDMTTIEHENIQLKNHLLCLIHDYKRLKNQVLGQSQSAMLQKLEFDGPSTSRKRLYTELAPAEEANDLVSTISDWQQQQQPGRLGSFSLDLSSPIDETDYENDDVLNYIKLDDEYDDDFEGDSPALSRTTSPSAMSETDENSMMSLTRSTTVSTNTSSFSDSRKPQKSKCFRFYDLPEFTTMNYDFTFNKDISDDNTLHSVMHEDKYNMVTDFLEEKLIDNDLSYYVENKPLEN